MLQLTINGLPAFPKQGSSFKLTRENPYFSDSGDYTLEVTLPLAGCPENLRIFGSLHRPEQRRAACAALRLPFSLLAPPLPLIEGTALVSAVTETEAKVQLLAGGSELKIRTADELGRDLYVSDLDLGRAWDTDFARCCPGKEYSEDGLMHWFWGCEGYGTACVSYPDHYLDGRDTLGGKGDGRIDLCDCALLPILDTREQEVLNARTLYVCHKPGRPAYTDYACLPGDPFLGSFIPPSSANSYAVWIEENFSHIRTSGGNLAPQPRVYLLVERVLRALGYEVAPADDCLRNSDWKHLILCNARRTLRYARMLPRWTVKEFLAEVEQFCGVKICVTGRDRAAIRPKADYYAANTHTFAPSGICAGPDTDIDSEQEEKDITRANVRYAFPADPHPAVALTDDILSRADVRVYGSYAELYQGWQALTAADRLAAVNYVSNFRYGCLVHTASDSIASYQGIAPYGPLVRDALNTDDFTELRIVPCDGFHPEPDPASGGSFEDPLQPGLNLSVYVWDPDLSLYVQTTAGSCVAPFLLRTQLDTVTEGTSFRAWDAVRYSDQEQAEEGEGLPEVMEVALTGAVKEHEIFVPATDFSDPATVTARTPHAVGIAYQANGDGKPEQMADTYGPLGSNALALVRFESTGDGLVAEALRPSAEFSATAKAETRFSFTGHVPPDTPIDSIFLIRGQRYACLKLEYTIDEHGLQPLKTGYFYEIN